ncbi:MAG: alpha-galactosidase [Prevotellaceae bacterium]|jgi:alpha-galactosidase|nr:alpha-galactosidase [Prevotellaceae bacterium]
MKQFLIPTLLLLTLAAHGQSTELLEVKTNDAAMIFTAKVGSPVLLQHWGGRLNDPAAFLLKSGGQQLFPAYGGKLYRSTALRLTHDDGVLTTELVYAGSETKAVDSNRTQTVLHLKDNLYPVAVDLHFTAYKAENVICQHVSISHQEKGAVKIANIASSYLSLHADAYYLTHFYGSWGAEMRVKEEPLTQGIKTVESKEGVRTTRFQNPSFLLSLNRRADEDYGEVYGGALAWSGSYKLTFEVDELGLLSVLGGINDFAAEYTLAPNQPFNTPQMALTYSAQGKGQASRSFHDWSRKYALAHGDKLNPVLLNSWEGAYFSFDEPTLTGMMDKAADFGIEMFVLDDGWFGNKYPRNSDKAGLGDWQVNRKKLPQGLDFLANYALSKGIRFGVWIEPEMVNPKSELAEKHPGWIVQSGKREIPQMRNQWLLDLTNPAVQDFVFNVFDSVLASSPHISYIKWDANRHVESVGSTYLPADRQTHFWYDYTQGLYSVYERVRAKYPDVEIQLCASGGGRLDYGALQYHDEFWASDNTNAIDRVFIQYGANHIYPAQATASHVSATPNHQTGSLLPLKFRFDVAMSGRLGMELQPKDIAGQDSVFAKSAIAAYKQIRPLVQLGDLYRIQSPYDESGYASLMYVAKDKKQAVFFAYSMVYHVRSSVMETKLKGLDPSKRYRITELNMAAPRSVFYGEGKTFSGDYLMKAGISLRIGKPNESVVLMLSSEE